VLDIRALSNIFLPQKRKVSEQIRMLCVEGLLIYTSCVVPKVLKSWRLQLAEHVEGGEYVINSSCETVKTSNWNTIRKWECNTKHKNEACSCNHCHGKAISIKYYECVLFSLTYPACTAHLPYCLMWPAQLYIIFHVMS